MDNQDIIFHGGKWWCLLLIQVRQGHFILILILIFFLHRNELANFIPSAMFGFAFLMKSQRADENGSVVFYIVKLLWNIISLIASVIMTHEVLMKWPGSVNLMQSSGGSHPLKGGSQKSLISRVTQESDSQCET